MLRSVNHLSNYRIVQWSLQSPYLNKLAHFLLNGLYIIIDRDIFIVNVVIILCDISLDIWLSWFDSIYGLLLGCFRFLFALGVDLMLHLILFGYWILNTVLIPIRIISDIIKLTFNRLEKSMPVITFKNTVKGNFQFNSKSKTGDKPESKSEDKTKFVETHLRMSPDSSDSPNLQSHSSDFSTPPPPIVSTNNNNLEIAMKNTATPTLMEVKDNVSVDYVNKITNIWEPLENDIANTTTNTNTTTNNTNTNNSHDGSSIHTSTHTSTRTSLHSERSSNNSHNNH